MIWFFHNPLVGQLQIVQNKKKLFIFPIGYISYLLVLLPVHGCPCELGWLQAVVEVALALRVGEKEHLKCPEK
jgi:hypothetical protein